jgi:hypothetical protein
VGSWTGKACARCSGKKGPKQRDKKYCFKCQREVDREQSRGAHARAILVKYGITSEQYNALYELQGGRCYLCRHATGKSKRLTVDHDHGCCPEPPCCGRCVRGLLCSNCNQSVLGWAARDKVDYFIRAIYYLIDPPFAQLQRGVIVADQAMVGRVMEHLEGILNSGG